MSLQHFETCSGDKRLKFWKYMTNGLRKINKLKKILLKTNLLLSNAYGPEFYASKFTNLKKFRNLR